MFFDSSFIQYYEMSVTVFDKVCKCERVQKSESPQSILKHKLINNANKTSHMRFRENARESGEASASLH